MSFPQPSADEYAINGSKFFRLNTPIASAGDMYESAQGSHAFALGPDSDISKVNLIYYDDQVSDFVQMTQISPRRAFTGRVDARNDSTYQPANRPGRILIYPDEIYDPGFRPAGFSALTDTIIFQTPLLDVLQYFTPQTSMDSTRNDKTFFASDLPIPAGDLFLVLPYYGRRYAMIELTNFSTGGPPPTITFGIQAVNFAITDNTAPTKRHQVTTILAAAPVAGAGGQSLTVMTSTAHGMFDVLLFSFSTLGGLPQFKVVVSDTQS